MGVTERRLALAHISEQGVRTPECVQQNWHRQTWCKMPQSTISIRPTAAAGMPAPHPARIAPIRAASGKMPPRPLPGVPPSEHHPFGQVWSDSEARLELGFNYFDRGPRRSEVAADVLYPAPANPISALLSSGCELVHVEESGDTRADWEIAPVAGLPETLFLVARRNDR
jgi:hypothetical protein